MRPLPEESIGRLRTTNQAPATIPGRIKQAGKVPIGELRNKLPGAAPCTGLLRESGNRFQGEERWQGYATYG